MKSMKQWEPGTYDILRIFCRVFVDFHFKNVRSLVQKNVHSYQISRIFCYIFGGFSIKDIAGTWYRRTCWRSWRLGTALADTCSCSTTLPPSSDISGGRYIFSKRTQFMFVKGDLALMVVNYSVADPDNFAQDSVFIIPDPDLDKI